MTLAISAHAIIRWLERVNGLDLKPYTAAIRECGGAVTDGALLDLVGCDLGQAQIDAACRSMREPWITTAASVGATSVAVGRVTLIIENGNVVTVKQRKAKFAPKRQARIVQMEDAE